MSGSLPSESSRAALTPEVLRTYETHEKEASLSFFPTQGRGRGVPMAADAARKTNEKHRRPVEPLAVGLVSDLLPPWLDRLRADDKAPRTVTRYDTAVRRFLTWSAGQEGRPATPADLTPIALVG